MFVKAIETMLSEVRANGGSTVDMMSGGTPLIGYMVGGIVDSLILPLDILNPDDNEAAVRSILSWIGEHSDVATQENVFLGGWIDQAESRLYIDLSERYYVKEYAEIIGKDRKEIAIWDIAEGSEIRF